MKSDKFTHFINRMRDRDKVNTEYESELALSCVSYSMEQFLEFRVPFLPLELVTLRNSDFKLILRLIVTADHKLSPV